MKTPAPPPAPDPAATAAAQSGLNRDTAVSQQLINMVDQVTPDGSLAYTQSGTNSYTDASGKVVTLPKFTATTTLSDAQKGIYDTNKVTEQNLANIGRDQSAKIGSILGTNVDLSNNAIEGRLMDLATQRLDPRFARDESALRSRLTNQGIMAGSDAWNAEMQRLGQTKNDAINQLLLTGRGQAVDEIMAQRNQPINEISALLSGSQVSQPRFTSTPSANVAGVDYTGLVNNNYNAAMQQYQAKQAQQNAMMGGLFGMAGSLGGMGIYRYSDRRLKTDVKKVGKLDSGHNLYSYRYKGDDAPQVGVMAQEVEKKDPHAVVADAMGRKMVDYSKIVGA